MTGRALVREGEEVLAAAGVKEPGYDARALFLFAAQLTLTDYVRSADGEVSEEVRAAFSSSCARRAEGEPLQYITGSAPFYGRDFYVDEGVLIPRFDTETLIEAVLPRMRRGMRVLDLCTGSGCIPVTLALEGPGETEVTGSDISEAALRVAGINASRLGADVRFIRSDLFLQISGRYDIITANPPYIRSADIDRLDKEVRLYEPRTALDGSEDGLLFYRRIAGDAGAHLVPGGLLVFETGADQAEDVRAVMRDSGFCDLTVFKDLAGLDRVVLGVWT